MVEMIDDLTNQNLSANFFYLLIGLLALISVVFVMGGDKGIAFILGRIMGFIIVVMLAYTLIEWITGIVEKPEPWSEKKDLDKDINLRVEDISELLERASEGKTKSQEILHEKLKKVFFLKLKEKMDISDKELKNLVREPEDFRELVEDEVIADFILSIEEESKKRSRKPRFLSSSSSEESKKKYKRKIKKIIKSIDRWEERYHG